MSIKTKVSKSTLQGIKEAIIQSGIQKVVVGSIVFDKYGRVLLLERASDEFKGGLTELPSGKMEESEDLLDGLVRELKEETGLKAILVERYVGYFDYLSSSGKKTRQLNFVVLVASGDVKINPEEHSNYYFVDSKSDMFAL